MKKLKAWELEEGNIYKRVGVPADEQSRQVVIEDGELCMQNEYGEFEPITDHCTFSAIKEMDFVEIMLPVTVQEALKDGYMHAKLTREFIGKAIENLKHQYVFQDDEPHSGLYIGIHYSEMITSNPEPIIKADCKWNDELDAVVEFLLSTEHMVAEIHHIIAKVSKYATPEVVKSLLIDECWVVSR